MGVQAGTIRWSLLAESSSLAVEGIAVGTVFAVVTAWLLYLNSPLFDGLRAGFVVAWTSIAVVVTAVLVATLVATFGSAGRAARTQPARALRAVH
jgi:putative ABC transport system permease protein